MNSNEMTFSEFCQMLYPYTHNDNNNSKSDFVIFLISQIMDESFTDDKAFLDLFAQESDTLQRYYTGARSLPRKTANTILKYLNKKRFKKFLSTLTDDNLALILNEMKEFEICSSQVLIKSINDLLVIDRSNIINICTKQFISILNNCAQKKRKISKKITPTQEMREIFEQAISQYKIAKYICDLKNYLSGEEAYFYEVFQFTETIKEKVLVPYVNHQNDPIYIYIYKYS